MTVRSRIPWIFAIGMLVVVAVNGAMMTAAITTFPGLAVERPYERGLAYNRVIDLQERQDRLGWTGTAVALPASDGGREIMVTLRDRDGAALDGLAVTGRLERPLERDAPRPLTFAARGAGVYAVAVDRMRAGQWDLTVDGVGADGRVRLRQRLVLR